MANHGNLTPILLEMHREGQSGVLRFERGKEKKQLLLIGGTLAGAESNLPGEHLARIMVAQGALPKPALREVTSLMKGGRGLEEALRSLAGAPKVAEGGASRRSPSWPPCGRGRTPPPFLPGEGCSRTG